MAGFEMAADLGAGVEQQQNDLRRAVDSGELWIEAGVAERAAQRCDQARDEINEWLRNTDTLTRKLPFGDNRDGSAASDRFIQAGLVVGSRRRPVWGRRSRAPRRCASRR